MVNTFLLVIILFVSFGLIHNKHQICEVENLKIVSVLDIKDDIKYFVTRNGSTCVYWPWNVNGEVRQSLTAKDTFGNGK